MLSKQEKIGNAALYAVIFAILLALVITLGNHPGLYFDAIFPDHIALQVLHPQEEQFRMQIAWPWLCQLYHGNVGVWLTALSVLITGTTSVLQHHIVYALVAACCVCLLYRVLTHEVLGVPRWWAAAVVVLLACWPSLLTIIITQFYMCLFGTACILWGTLLLFNWMKDKSRSRALWGSYLLFGLAFYSYFNFLFFLPALLIVTAYHLKRENCLTFDRLVPPLIAYLAGCGFYVLGYSQRALDDAGVAITAPRRILLLAVFCLLLAGLFVAFVKKIRLRFPLLGLYAVGAVAWAVAVLPRMSAHLESLQVLGVTPTTFAGKLAKIVSDYGSILSGKYAEEMIYGQAVVTLPISPILVVAAVAAVTLVLEILAKQYDWRWKAAGGTMLLFFCCCVVFGSRMQPQHYVPILFVTAALLCLCLLSMVRSVGELLGGRKHASGVKVAALVLTVLAVAFNVFNQTQIIRQIHLTGGEGKWSGELTELAEDALAHQAAGEQELYLFDQWGFYAGFNYLTMNRVPFLAEVKEDVLARYYASGAKVIACYWEEKDEGKYRALFETVGKNGGTIEVTPRMDHNGQPQFYEMTLSNPEGAAYAG
jgi:hypothetical protein